MASAVQAVPADPLLVKGMPIFMTGQKAVLAGTGIRDGSAAHAAGTSSRHALPSSWTLRPAVCSHQSPQGSLYCNYSTAGCRVFLVLHWPRAPGEVRVIGRQDLIVAGAGGVTAIDSYTRHAGMAD